MPFRRIYDSQEGTAWRYSFDFHRKLLLVQRIIDHFQDRLILFDYDAVSFDVIVTPVIWNLAGIGGSKQKNRNESEKQQRHNGERECFLIIRV